MHILSCDVLQEVVKALLEAKDFDVVYLDWLGCSLGRIRFDLF